jgi:hypothetical protein
MLQPVSGNRWGMRHRVTGVVVDSGSSGGRIHSAVWRLHAHVNSTMLAAVLRSSLVIAEAIEKGWKGRRVVTWVRIRTVPAWLHLGVAVVLCFSFARAPLQHAHASDPHHEHARGFAHFHWADYSKDRLVEDYDPDSDARMIDWLAGDGNGPTEFVIALQDCLIAVVLVPQDVRIRELTPRNHDPPSRLIPHLRGPPA